MFHLTGFLGYYEPDCFYKEAADVLTYELLFKLWYQADMCDMDPWLQACQDSDTSWAVC